MFRYCIRLHVTGTQRVPHSRDTRYCNTCRTQSGLWGLWAESETSYYPVPVVVQPCLCPPLDIVQVYVCGSLDIIQTLFVFFSLDIIQTPFTRPKRDVIPDGFMPWTKLVYTSPSDVCVLRLSAATPQTLFVSWTACWTLSHWRHNLNSS